LPFFPLQNVNNFKRGPDYNFFLGRLLGFTVKAMT
jgi:hypothetical protein